MKNEDELLDEITAYLRNEAVPPPPQFRVPLHVESRPHKGGTVAIVGALVVSVFGVLLWRGDFSAQRHSRSLPTPDSTSVTVVQTRDARRLQMIEAELDEIEAEIRNLYEQAERLDALRKAESLLTQY